MTDISVNGSSYCYQVEMKHGESKGKIAVFFYKEEEEKNETLEVRTIMEEEEKFREYRDKETGELKQEMYIEKVPKRVQVPVVTVGMTSKPVKMGEIPIYTMMWPHQLKATVINYVQSKSK